MLVRARYWSDIRNLHERFKNDYVMTTPAASESRDYRWRISLKRSDWAKIITTRSAEIDYTKFKSEIEKHADQHDKLNSYLIIWSVMLRLQKLDSPSWKKPPKEPPSVFPEDWGLKIREKAVKLKPRGDRSINHYPP